MEMKGIHWTVAGTLAVASSVSVSVLALVFVLAFVLEGAEKGDKVSRGFVATAYTSGKRRECRASTIN